MGIAALHPSYDCFFKSRDGLLRFARNDGKTSAQHTIVIPAKAGIQYAAAFRFYHFFLWDTGSPAFAGDDD